MPGLSPDLAASSDQRIRPLPGPSRLKEPFTWRRARSVAESLWRFPGAIKVRRHLARHRFAAPRSGPVLNYGNLFPIASGEVVHGGKVKLLHLSERFPERPEFNILYLVSSACPPHALELVQWAKRQGAKFVWNQNGVAFPAWAGARAGEINSPMAALMLRADFIVYQSRFCLESAGRFLGGAPCPADILFNPVDPRVFTPATAPRPTDVWQLLTAGTHHQASRVLSSIETLRLLREAGHNVRLKVAGELRWPEATRQVRNALEKANVPDLVTLLPPFTQDEAVRLYQGAHILLHPKYHDPCPTVVIEAMACGVPVIGSRSGGMPEIVNDEGGRLLDVPLSWEVSTVPEPQAMANAVEHIMREWPEQSRRARQRAERLFDSRRWLQRHAEIFDELLRRSGSH